jgi:aminobenzoyl-glutamate utilization protein B
MIRAGLALILAAAAANLGAVPAVQAAPAAPRISGLKARAAAGVEARAKLAQEINDSLFSFAELAFQEVETARYLTRLLEENGFSVERGQSGLPTAWVARWTQGRGGPVIALGSDIDGIPKASQKPGIPWREPMVAGAPGHGEGHNSGQAVNVAAALAVKELMIREKIPGTLMLWPGVAEELLGAKAYFVRDGLFKGVDAVIFTHVGDNLETGWGQPPGTGLVSVEYRFEGESAHSAGAPWRGRSALDAVELMNIGWNMRREHLRPEQRSHYVITDGGDQPNVVPSVASVWYFVREQDFERIRANFALANEMAEGAARMTGTKVTRRILGAAAPRHFNKPMAEAAYANIRAVGLPRWTEGEQAFAKLVQKNVGAPKQPGLATELARLEPPLAEPKSGGSDDIGDVSWAVPTITIRYPSNIPELPGHNWSNAIAMATPIAHKGVVAGGKAVAMTLLDLLTRPKLRQEAKAYFAGPQRKDQTYVPVIGEKDKPPIEFNTEIMARYRPELSRFYYDPARYPTYLEQLGIGFPILNMPPVPAKQD